MRALLLKDIINLKTYGRSILIVLAVFTAVSFFSNDSSFATTFISVLLAIMAITSMSYDELAKWNQYALSMPISRRDLVLGKYLLALLLTAFGVCISLVIALIPVWMGNAGEILPILLTVFTSASVGIIMLSVLFPLVYKYGVEKSRVLFFIIMFIPSVGLAIFAQTGLIMPEQISEQWLLGLLKLLPVLALALLAISYFVSASIFNKKDL